MRAADKLERIAKISQRLTSMQSVNKLLPRLRSALYQAVQSSSKKILDLHVWRNG